jgi:hypothetical protein
MSLKTVLFANVLAFCVFAKPIAIAKEQDLIRPSTGTDTAIISQSATTPSLRTLPLAYKVNQAIAHRNSVKDVIAENKNEEEDSDDDYDDDNYADYEFDDDVDDSKEMETIRKKREQREQELEDTKELLDDADEAFRLALIAYEPFRGHQDLPEWESGRKAYELALFKYNAAKYPTEKHERVLVAEVQVRFFKNFLRETVVNGTAEDFIQVAEKLADATKKLEDAKRDELERIFKIMEDPKDQLSTLLSSPSLVATHTHVVVAPRSTEKNVIREIHRQTSDDDKKRERTDATRREREEAKQKKEEHDREINKFLDRPKRIAELEVYIADFRWHFNKVLIDGNYDESERLQAELEVVKVELEDLRREQEEATQIIPRPRRKEFDDDAGYTTDTDLFGQPIEKTWGPRIKDN